MERFKRLVYKYGDERYMETSTKLWVDDRRKFWHVESLNNQGFKGAILIDVPQAIYRGFKVVGIADCSAEDWYDTNLWIEGVVALGGNND